MNYMVLATSVQGIKEGIGDAIESGGEYDYIQIIQSVSDIRRVIGFLYGFLIVVIMIVVPIIITLELMYICFPILRVQMENLAIKVEGSGFVGKAVGFSLRDARTAIQKSETNLVGKHPLTIYLKLKCTSMMMVMLVIAIVLTGADSFIGFVRSLVDNVISHIFY